MALLKILSSGEENNTLTAAMLTENFFVSLGELMRCSHDSDMTKEIEENNNIVFMKVEGNQWKL